MRAYIVSGLISLIVSSGIGCESISEVRRERLIKSNVPEDYNQVIERSKKREDYELEEIRRKLREEELKKSKKETLTTNLKNTLFL